MRQFYLDFIWIGNFTFATSTATSMENLPALEAFLVVLWWPTYWYSVYLAFKVTAEHESMEHYLSKLYGDASHWPNLNTMNISTEYENEGENENESKKANFDSSDHG